MMIGIKLKDLYINGVDKKLEYNNNKYIIIENS